MENLNEVRVKDLRSDNGTEFRNHKFEELYDEKCPGNTEYFPYIPAYENTTPSESPILQEYVISEDPPEFTKDDNHPALNKPHQTESVDLLEPTEPQTYVIFETISDVQPSPTISPSAKVILQTLVPQDRL
uniref:Uncharacterized protein n=1 Tax=Tanacetum cinerariifolium TaxID=118510 RepID=A0A699HHI3_TANCI|nr:hypothetical protein [Tanacetum cinerariifolium]